MDEKGEVINLINKLQSYRSTGCKIDIQLPQIVVVGAQSSGKSSVLDGLIGDSILPRGSGTVTKCPIIVQLFCTANLEEEGIEIQDAPDIGRTKDNDIVRKWIGDEMESGDGGIKDKPIIVKVYSPTVVTLTVVDLPGIKRLSSTGEPDDIEKLIFDMSRRYINEKNAIILAVSPANYDICNSDGILLAKEADPDGDRTIGVLTKLDLMDEGTDARNLLTGTSADVNVKLGMIGLVNRSQKDIDNNVSVDDQLKKEKAFLHKTYTDIASKNGVPFLRKRLQDLLVNHITKCLPGILVDMEKLRKKCEAQISDIPEVTTIQDKFRYVSRIITSFENRTKTEIEGSPRTPDYDHLYGGIKIKDIFETEFAMEMDAAASRASLTSNGRIVIAFRNSGSFDTFFLNPEAVFKKLAQEQVKEMEEPALRCATKVHEEIVKMADRFLQERKDSFALFPELRKSIKEVVLGMLSKKLDDVKRQVQDYIRVQASMVFSLDKSFTDHLSQLRRQLEKNLHEHSPEVSPVEESKHISGTIREVRIAVRKLAPVRTDSQALLVKLQGSDTIKLVKEMVNLYFEHTKLQIQDYIPKLVTNKLIKQFSTEDTENGGLGEELRVHVMDKYEALVNLPSTISEQREANVKLRNHLNDVIGEVKSLLSFHHYENLSSVSDFYDNENGQSLMPPSQTFTFSSI